jgi:hypothetical protein
MVPGKLNTLKEVLKALGKCYIERELVEIFLAMNFTTQHLLH